MEFPAMYASVMRDVYHLAMAAYYTARLALEHRAVQNTYRYGFHLEQVSFVDRRFRRWLSEHPEVIDALKPPVLFLDAEPEIDRLRACPAGSLGREYYAVARQYESGERAHLRGLRLRTLPHEQRGLDRTLPAAGAGVDARHRWLMARRNVYMTSSHDFAHLLTGCDVSYEGEALVAMYQFSHLRVPSNFLNMWNACAMLCATGKVRKVARVRRLLPQVRASTNPLVVSWERLWDVPLPEARRRVGLPPEGLQLAAVPARR